MPKKTLVDWIKKLFESKECSGECGCHRVVDKLLEQNIPGHRGTGPYPKKRDPSDDYPQGGLKFKKSQCCGARVDYTEGGFRSPYCSKCNKPHTEPTYG